MINGDISFEGKEVAICGLTWQSRWPIQKAIAIGERVFLLYDYMSVSGSEHFPNLEAFSMQGESLWRAEHATKTATDSYVSIQSSSDPSVLFANTFAGYQCRISTATGKLVDTKFTK